MLEQYEYGEVYLVQARVWGPPLRRGRDEPNQVVDRGQYAVVVVGSGITVHPGRGWITTLNDLGRAGWLIERTMFSSDLELDPLSSYRETRGVMTELVKREDSHVESIVALSHCFMRRRIVAPS